MAALTFSKPSSWARFKILLWKNWRTHSRRKVQSSIELLSPLVMGLFFILLRGLQPAPGLSPSALYPDFSPFHLPAGKVLNLDGLLNTNKIINSKAPIAEGMCELIRQQQLNPSRFSARSILNLSNKLQDLDASQIDFTRPEVKNWFNMVDLPKLMGKLNFSASSEDLRDILPLLQDVQNGGSILKKRMLTDSVIDLLQSRREEFVDKIKEANSKTSSIDPSLKRWLVVWSPANKLLSSIMDAASERTPFIGCGVNNASLLLDALTRPLPFNQESYILAGVSFADELRNVTVLPAHLSVSLRFPGLSRLTYDEKLGRDVDAFISPQRTNWDTTYVFPKNPTPGARNPNEPSGGSPGYWREGFLGLQASVSAAVAAHYNQTTGGRMPPLNVRLQRFPEPAVFADPHSAVIFFLVVTGFNLSFIYLVMTTTRMITAEKESQLKETLKILGVSNLLHWAAWFVPAFLSFLFGSTCLAIMLQFPVDALKIFPSSHGFYILLLFAVYSLTAVFICFFISVCFSSASDAAAASSAIWLGLSLVYGFAELAELRVPYARRIWLSLVPNCAINNALKTVMDLEATGLGLTWDTLFYTIPDSDDVSVGDLMQMLLAESVFLMLATLYLEAIRPGSTGIPLPWYFPLQRSFWCGAKRMPYVEKADNQSNMLLESEPQDIPAGVQIRNLRKVYANGKVAVHGLSLNLYEGQITVLLGHNGAGKTTTMSMLTGITAASAGAAVVAGADLTQDLKAARQHLGLCPQGNILIEDLTVTEHLHLFCQLKGLTCSAAEAETNKYIRILQLEPKANELSKNLSGGMKRKLAAAIALCGGSKVVLFDEPTAGMDPAARRALWDLLQSEKTGRTVLLTTHFMDEADLLGDRIAIMSEGRLRAAGSSFFLKKQCGGGYRVVLVKDPGCKSTEVTTFLQSFFPDIEAASDVGSELSYLLPDNFSNSFEAAFKALENNKNSLCINSYGVTTATIEDVFMNVVTNSRRRRSLRANSVSEPDSQSDNSDTCVTLGEEPLLTGLWLLLRQVLGLLSKHWLLFARSPVAHFFALIGPGCLAVVTIKTAGTWQGTHDLPPRNFTFKDYSLGYASILGTNSGQSPLAKALAALVTADGGAVEDIGDYSDPHHAILNLFAEKPLDALSNFIFGVTMKDDTVTGIFNNQGFHTAPLALQFIYNSFLQSQLNDSIKLSFTNQPLPYSGIMKTVIQQKGMNVSFNLAYNAAIGFGLVVSWLLMSHVRERSGGSKLLQLMAGVNPVLFWAVTFLWDLLFSVLSGIIFSAVVFSYQEEGFATLEDASKLLVVATTFFLVALPLSYLCSLLMQVPAAAFMTLSVSSYVIGPLGFVFTALIRFHKLTSQSVLDWWTNLLTWSPSYAVAEALQNLNKLYWLQEFCQPIFEKYCSLDNIKHVCCRDESQCPPEGCVHWTDDFLDDIAPGVGAALRACLITGGIATILLLLIEMRFFYAIRSKLTGRVEKTAAPLRSPDADVDHEWELVRAVHPAQRRDYNLLVRELSKRYGKLEAVKSLSLMVPPGECFGLLGVNGAGKTTAFRMLTGDLEPTSGDAYVHGSSIRLNRKQVHQLVGYCPQFDALLEELTGRETLRMFCMLRGVPDQEVELTCEKLARELLFYPHIDYKVREYSGGNKRKLSTAVALVGDPPVVYLDEPTTGMDPVAKRYFWNVISKLRAMGKTIILTSHSMEECEALCTRVGIMVNGELLCLGSPQYLKTKFAQGYSLTVKTRLSTPKRRSPERPLTEFIQEKLPGAVLKEEHEGVLTFHVPASSGLSWAAMFGAMEVARSQGRIDDYYLGQTSLEEVFLSFASASLKSD